VSQAILTTCRFRTEADLDVEYTVGLATDTPVTFLTVGGAFVQAVLDTTTYLASAPNPPSVMTTSYGGSEASFSPTDARYLTSNLQL
jgi:tripeptidyl-peptidase-1